MVGDIYPTMLGVRSARRRGRTPRIQPKQQYCEKRKSIALRARRDGKRDGTSVVWRAAQHCTRDVSPAGEFMRSRKKRALVATTAVVVDLSIESKCRAN